jgi:hypothetical protein
MDHNYNWSNPVFKNRAGDSLNLAVNYLVDVLHTLAVESTAVPVSEPIPLWMIGVTMVTVAVIAIVAASSKRKHRP